MSALDRERRRKRSGPRAANFGGEKIDNQLLIKIGVAIGAVVLGYVVVKIIANLLASIAVWSSPDTQNRSDMPSDADEEPGEEVEDVPGLHVLSGFGSEHRFIDKNPTEKTIRATIRDLDWFGGFHQVLLVTSPGVYFAVSGSLDPDHGLSSSYDDAKKGVHLVINEPPESVANMEELMVSFYHGDGRWKRLSIYE